MCITKSLLFLFLIHFCTFKLIVEQPQSLKDILNEDKQPGSIEYSVSLFGEVLYNKTEILKVFIPDDENNIWGCENLKAPELAPGENFVWLFQRGNCSFQKKTYNAQ